MRRHEGRQDSVRCEDSVDANETYSELGLVWYMVCDVWFVSVGCGCVGGRTRLSVVQLWTSSRAPWAFSRIHSLHAPHMAYPG